MKKLLYTGIAFILFIIAGCQEKIESETPVPEDTIIEVSISTPEEPDTRLNLTPEAGTKNIIIKWKVGDVIKFFYSQGDTKIEGTSVTLTSDNITENGKKAKFTIAVPGQINRNENFTLYSIHSLNSFLNNGSLFVNVAPIGFDRFENINCIPIVATTEVTPSTSIIGLNFQHIGVLQCLTLKNNSYQTISICPTLKNPDSISWYVDYCTEFSDSDYYYDIINGTIKAALKKSAVSTVSCAPGETVQLVQWVKSKNINTPEIKIHATINGNSIVSTNSKPARGKTMEVGKAYHLYAIWEGGNLRFTDATLNSPNIPGSLIHADAGTNIIGVVYSKKNNNVYYNSTQDGNTWLGETFIGSGYEARLEIDANNNPHIVFTTNDRKIAYRKKVGDTWGETQYFTSMNGGQCSKPDIAVDNNSYAHITYTDTKGNTGDYVDYPDIMHAYNSGGTTFNKSLLMKGFRTAVGDGTWYGVYVDRGSHIALNASGQFHILYQYQTDHSSGYKNYYLELYNTTKKYSTQSSQSDIYEAYDLEYDGTNFIALYKNNNYFSGTLKMEGSSLSFVNPQQITTDPVILHSISHKGDVGGRYLFSNLFYKYMNGSSGTEVVRNDINITNGSKVEVVRKRNANNQLFVLYSENNDNPLIKIIVVTN